MTQLLSNLYRFNGQCELSRDGDLVLIFDDGAVLKTHSLILRKASPVLAEILSGDNDGILPMKNIDCFIWCVILNYLYPGILHNDESVLLHDLVIEGVIREADRYGIRSVVMQVDREITKILYETKLRIEHRLIEIPEAFDEIKRQERVMIAAAKFQLPAALTAANKCLATFLTETLKHSALIEQRNYDEKLTLDYKNSILSLSSDRLEFSNLIEAGYSDVFFRFRSIFIAYES